MLINHTPCRGHRWQGKWRRDPVCERHVALFVNIGRRCYAVYWSSVVTAASDNVGTVTFSPHQNNCPFLAVTKTWESCFFIHFLHFDTVSFRNSSLKGREGWKTKPTLATFQTLGHRVVRSQVGHGLVVGNSRLTFEPKAECCAHLMLRLHYVPDRAASFAQNAVRRDVLILSGRHFSCVRSC